MTEWRECKLNDIVIFGNGKARPKTRGNIPVYGGNGILEYADQSNYDGETIIIGRVGAYCGSVYYENRPVWVSDNALSAKAKNNYSTKYLFYLLKLLDLNKLAEGSSHPLLTQTLLNSIETVFCSNVFEQKAIAEVLSSLDDKIDLLTRQNKTLEDLAQAYFRKWFIEDASEEWEEKGLDEIAEFLNGLPLQKYPYTTGKPLYVIKIKELNNGFSDNSDLCSSDVPEQYIVNSGDVIFSWSGSLMVDIWKYGKGALNQHLFKVTSRHYPKWFYYFWIKHHMPKFKIIAESKATTMGHIQRRDLSNAIVLVPESQEFATMDSVMRPIFDKIEKNNAQILVLQKLRDTLLPKLISGEIRVKM